jgi:ribonuclease P protein component
VERKTFSKNERIRKKSDFERFRALRRETTKMSRGPFTLIRLPNDLDITRIGIRVGRKIGKAHVRNRIKRLIREVFRQNKNAFPPSSDLLIIVTKTPTVLTQKSFMDDLLYGAKRLSNISKVGQEVTSAKKSTTGIEN